MSELREKALRVLDEEYAGGGQDLHWALAVVSARDKEAICRVIGDASVGYLAGISCALLDEFLLRASQVPVREVALPLLDKTEALIFQMFIEARMAIAKGVQLSRGGGPRLTWMEPEGGGGDAR